MTKLITPAQFAVKTVGVPWVKWRSDFEAMDCFGCVILYHRHVLGIDLGNVPLTDIETGFNAFSGWVECEPDSGATCFMAWRDGAPTHCGVLLSPTEVIHAEGSDLHPGSVKVSRIAAIRRMYGVLKFYRYQNADNS